MFELWTKVEMGGIDMRELTVKELREALVGVPGDLPVRLSSDTGVGRRIWVYHNREGMQGEIRLYRLL